MAQTASYGDSSNFPQKCIHGIYRSVHLGLVPSLRLGPAPVSNVFVLSFDFSYDAAEVQVPVVVHCQNDGGVGHLCTELSQLLQGSTQGPGPAALTFSNAMNDGSHCPGGDNRIEIRGGCLYRIIEGSEETEFIGQGIHLGLQLHLVHVSSIHILEKSNHGDIYSTWYLFFSSVKNWPSLEMRLPLSLLQRCCLTGEAVLGTSTWKSTKRISLGQKKCCV